MPSPVPFRDVRRLIEQAGWSLDRINGSHHIFTKKGCRNLIIPVHGNKVRWAYLKHAEKEIRASTEEDSLGDGPAV